MNALYDLNASGKSTVRQYGIERVKQAQALPGFHS